MTFLKSHFSLSGLLLCAALFVIIFLASCDSEKDKEDKALYKEATLIMSRNIAALQSKGYTINVDSMTSAFAKKAHDSLRVAFKYAIDMQNSISTFPSKSEIDAIKDTTKIVDLELVKVWSESYNANLKFQLKNFMDKHVDNCWLKISLKDKTGGYLRKEEVIMFDNVRPNGISVTDETYLDLNPKEIGEILIEPYRLEIEGKVYKFYANSIRLTDNKFGIKVNL